VLDAAAKISKQLSNTLPTAPGGKSPGGQLFASLGQLGANKNGNSSGIGLNANDGIGIGRTGLKNAGQLKTGNIGRRKVVAMTVDRSRVTTPPTAVYDRNAIAKVIDEHLAEISRCYEGALLSSPNLSGNLTFEWIIGTNGAVAGIKLKGGSLAGSPVAPCVSASIKQWRFPPPRGGQVTVSYPFGFRSTGF